MRDSFLLPEIRELVHSDNKEELLFFLEDLHSATAAEFLAALEINEILTVFSWLDASQASDIFSNFEIDDQLAIIKSADPAQTGRILEQMPPDDRADLFNELSQAQKDRILPTLSKAERDDINKLSSYPEGSAGAAMTSDYVTLPMDITSAQAIEKLRREAPSSETIYYAYCVNEKQQLIGFVSLKDLILSEPDERILEFMHTEVFSVNVETDQEEVARIIRKYDLIAIPVTDKNGVLTGIITHDDALDIIIDEHTEDIEKLMAISGAHEAGAYLKTSSFEHFRNRAGWLSGLAIAGMVSGMVIHSFESELEKLMILALYMPMIADSGGNSGSQASTVIIRALALKEFEFEDIWQILLKELKTSSMLAAVLSLIALIKVLFLSAGTTIPEGYSLLQIGSTIALALGLQVISSTLIGVLLPFMAVKLKKDPALIASPALTTVVDITGLLIYFTTARILLKL